MITFTTIMMFLGVWCFYHTSQRVELPVSLRLERWIHQNPGSGKAIGSALLLSSLIACISHWGVGSGFFAFFVMLTVGAGLVIILAPLHQLTYRSVGLVFLVSLVLEIFMVV